MNKYWFDFKALKCVILCAGKGNRILPHSKKLPKVMIKIRNKPILDFVIDYWKKYTNDFIFVVGYKKDQVIDFVRQLPINSQFVEQKELKGIADAVSYVKDFVSDRFIVVLGDCICCGRFMFPENIEFGVGVWKTNNVENIKQSYSIKIKDDLICEVKEKPKEIFNNLCGMGFYFLNKKIFDYIKITEPSKLRNEIEITDVIQNMIDAGEEIKPVFFNGNYINITFPEDIKKQKKFF